ncbi:MAG: ABC transporter permease [Rhodospirillales bacterium]
MIRYVAGRLAALPLSLLVVSLLTFTFLHLVPGDPIDAMGGENLSAAEAAQLRAEMGLDRPLPIQFLTWLSHVVQGDLGRSIRTGRPVFDEVMSRLGTSVELAVLAILMALAIGIVGGGVATLFRGRWIDRAVMGLATIGMSIPNYFAATLFVLAVSLYLPDLGVISYAPLSKGVLANVQSLFFPALALAILSGSTFCHYVRGATEDIVRNADFIRTARSKGASQRRILLRHVLPNALVPLATVAGLQLAYLIGGAVVIESIFALPGLGQLLLAAIAQRDYPIIQGCVLLKATTFVMINLAIDLLYPVLDPRVQTAGRGG